MSRNKNKDLSGFSAVHINGITRKFGTIHMAKWSIFHLKLQTECLAAVAKTVNKYLKCQMNSGINIFPRFLFKIRIRCVNNRINTIWSFGQITPLFAIKSFSTVQMFRTLPKAALLC